MKVINSSLFKDVKEIHHLLIGDFYFFENIVIAEIKEGVHIDSISSEPFFKLSNKFYSEKKAFGYISNRINQFSVSPLDFAQYSEKLDNVESFCAVCYSSHFDEMNVQIEKRFSQKPFNATSNLEEAFEWTSKIISQTKNISA